MDVQRAREARLHVAAGHTRSSGGDLRLPRAVPGPAPRREADKIPQRIGSGLIIGEHVFIANENGTLQCLEWKSGKTMWVERLGGNSWGSLVYADDKLW